MSKNFLLNLLFFSLFSFSIIAMEERIEINSEEPSNANGVNFINLETGVGKIRDIKCNFSGNKIAVIGENSNIAEVWNINTGSLVCKLNGHKQPIRCLLWHPTKDIIFTGSEDSKINLWDASTGECINHIGFRRTIWVTSLAYSEFNDGHPLVLAGTDKESAILRIKTSKNKLKCHHWSISDSFLPGNPTNTSISYLSFNPQGSLAFVVAEGILRIYTRPENFSRSKIKWPLICENDLGQKIESITSNDNGYIFIRLKNTSETGIFLNIINSKIIPIAKDIADYCPNTNCVLIIKDQRYIGEYKSTRDKEFEGQIIIEEDSNIQRAIYNSSGDKIIIIKEDNTMHIWTKTNDNWVCTWSYKSDYLQNSENHLILSKNRPIIARVNGNVISILKAIENNQFIEDDNRITEPEIIDLTQIEDTDQPINKQTTSLKRKSIDCDKNIQASKAQKISDRGSIHTIRNHETERDESDTEEHESSSASEKEIEQDNNYEQEHISAIEISTNRDNLDQSNIVASQNKQHQPKQLSDRAQAERKIALYRYDLIRYDRDILNKSLSEIITNYPEEIIEKYWLYKSLINETCDLNKPDDQGRTAIYNATDNNRLFIVQLLAEHDADVNIPDKQGLSPLHLATRKSYIPIAKYLLAHKALVNSKTCSGETPLHTAIKNKDFELIRLLLNANADIDAIDDQSNTPLTLVNNR